MSKTYKDYNKLESDDYGLDKTLSKRLREKRIAKEKALLERRKARRAKKQELDSLVKHFNEKE